ncbi:related to TEL2 Protein involved in controlling telomere length and position effect [Cephalotrichum gorgonifer]|uniref:Related to TEL2 Protein involved in controlling telomere length and position effect n=1 Tax=Cephalotrichum gorgonifer TaxID=2041049 RepID=A0AAE8SQU6_9PEZI|nr:related to TEL2 Protein involved in controlling telomere length and position effect [Cephalotrichum gorgonifer]
MDDFFTPVSTTYTKSKGPKSPNGQVGPSEADAPGPKNQRTGISSPEDALETLRAQPDYDTLISALKYLSNSEPTVNSFDIHVSSPLSAQITQALVTEIAPNYWPLLREGSLEVQDDLQTRDKTTDLALFLTCLRSLAGLNTILLRLRALTQEIKAGKGGPKRPDLTLNVNLVLELLCALLEGDDTVRSIWLRATPQNDDRLKNHQVSHELVSSLARGKVVSLAAEAEALAGEARSSTHWVSNGQRYSKWLSLSIASWIKNDPSDEELNLCGELLVRSLSLGYPEVINGQLFDALLLRKDGNLKAFIRLLGALSPAERGRVFYSLLQYLTSTFFGKPSTEEASTQSPVISAAAGLIRQVAYDDAFKKTYIVDWLAGPVGAGPGANIAIRRAVFACLAADEHHLADVLEKSMDQFALAQVILLGSGYLHRLSPRKLKSLSRSRTYLAMVSNRLNSPQTTARFLGMTVGEALSSLVDDEKTRLDLHMDEMQTNEAKWYKGLVNIADEAGPVDILISRSAAVTKHAESRKPAQLAPKPKSKPVAKPAAEKPKFIIEEVDTSESEDDIVPYAKPDSDAEDSDDDPALVRRDKPKAPVYIRTLISYFRDTDSYDKQLLALTTAPSLIRRKATFGTEVSDHADELASLLIGIHDKFDFENFYELRLQGILALIVAQPKTMAPWFAKTFFDGDYSISQRAAIIAALGLAARELAGYEQSEYSAAASFPSKRLSEKMEQQYLEPGAQGGEQHLPGSSLGALPPTALDSIAQSMTSSFLAPIAATAADNVTGPDALKLSTFKSKAAARKKPRVVRSAPNTTANLISTCFFFPLTARLQHALRNPSSQVLDPHLLSTFLKTIAVLVHAAGPSTTSLQDMTSESWGLVLALRSHSELPVLAGAVTVLAVLVEVNEGDYRGLCERQGKEIVETVEWLSAVLGGVRGGETEEDRVRGLAAGVMIRLNEVVERYQVLLMGSLV